MTEAFLTREASPNEDLLAEPVWCMSPHGYPTLVRHKEHVKRLGGPIPAPADYVPPVPQKPSELKLAQAELERLKAEAEAATTLESVRSEIAKLKAAAHKPKKES